MKNKARRRSAGRSTALDLSLSETPAPLFSFCPPLCPASPKMHFSLLLLLSRPGHAGASFFSSPCPRLLFVFFLRHPFIRAFSCFIPSYTPSASFSSPRLLFVFFPRRRTRRFLCAVRFSRPFPFSARSPFPPAPLFRPLPFSARSPFPRRVYAFFRFSPPHPARSDFFSKTP